jgi:hypothetical protein
MIRNIRYATNLTSFQVRRSFGLNSSIYQQISMRPGAQLSALSANPYNRAPGLYLTKIDKHF